MTNKLIVLIDASAYARSVCENAAWIAGRTGAPVELLHVLGRRERGRADLSGSIALGARTKLLNELAALDEEYARLAQQKGWAILEGAEAVIRAAGVENVTARLRHGDLVEVVAEAETDSCGIVIGKRGEGADFARMHLGSNLERIIRSATKPVFVAARAFRPVGKVLIAFDGGPSSTRAVQQIAGSPLFAGLEVRLVTVGDNSPERRHKLEAAQAILQSAGREASAEIVPGQPEKILSDIIEHEGFDLLAMGTYGHSRIRSLIIGSTTTGMIRSCKVPVALFR